MYVKMIFAQYKIKTYHILQTMYIFVILMKYQPLISLK